MKKLVVPFALLAALVGCDSGTTPGDSPQVDTGVAHCRKLVNPTNDVPTDKQIDEVRAAYENSQFSDLKRAGLKHLKLVEAYYLNDTASNLGEIVVAKQMLVETCARHGVVIPAPSPPTMPTLPPMPVIPELPMAPVPLRD